jgi:hypothetical protein
MGRGEDARICQAPYRVVMGGPDWAPCSGIARLGLKAPDVITQPFAAFL